MSGFASGAIGMVLGVAIGAGGFLTAHHLHEKREHDGREGGDHRARMPASERPAATAEAAPPTCEKPAYLVVLGEVLDRERFMADYTAKLPPLYAEHGGAYLAAGRTFETFEGEGDFKSFVISKWPSMAAVKGFWTSPEYDALRRARIEGNWGRFDVFALEGLPDPACAAK